MNVFMLAIREEHALLWIHRSARSGDESLSDVWHNTLNKLYAEYSFITCIFELIPRSPPVHHHDYKDDRLAT